MNTVGEQGKRKERQAVPESAVGKRSFVSKKGHQHVRQNTGTTRRCLWKAEGLAEGLGACQENMRPAPGREEEQKALKF